MARLSINGTSIEYREAGHGDPLVLVHGSASDARTWDRQWEQLAKSFRVIRYSRRYHWPNDPITPGVDYSMPEHVADLKALLITLGAAPAHLVGHSYGGFLCLLLALQERSVVRTLVLAEAPAITLFVSNTPSPTELLRLLATRPRTAAAMIRFGAKGVVPARKAFLRGDLDEGARIFGNAVFGPGGFDRLPESQKTQVRDNLSNVREELLGPGFEPLASSELRNMRVPTLLMTGENSISLFHCLTDRLAELLPRSERIEIPNASHLMHENNAPAFNSAVHSFIAANSRPAARSTAA